MSLRDYSSYEAHVANGLAWAVAQWKAQVESLPVDHPQRETLDTVWRQVVAFHGEDPDKVLGPSHQMLVEYYRKKAARAPKKSKSSAS